MKIYTDIDYVLHDYTPSFLESALDYFKTNYPPKKILVPKGKYNSPITPYVEAFDMSNKMIDHIVDLANEKESFCPTPCYKHIIDFLNSGNKDVVVITARSNRRGAERIVNKCFGRSVPVVTTDTHNKHLLIEDGSIYFEDHPDAINGVLQNRKDVLMVVPKWPWNIDIPKSRSIIHLEPNKFANISKLIEERLLEYV
jgi:hypothetical protein